MFILYSVLLTVAFVILSPRFLFDALRRGKYAAGFWQRLGYLPKFNSNGRPVIWLHCVSVGETQAARPLVDELLKQYPDHKIVVSTITKTGQQIAQQLFADKAALIFYFPFDWKFTVRRALKKINPKAVLLMETELWFRFLREAHKSGVKVAVVNGRLSARSVKRFLYIRGFMAQVLNYVDLALMQTQPDADRFKQLEMQESRIRVTGNIKYDLTTDAQPDPITKDLADRFGFTPQTRLIVAASTHNPEEEIVFAAFRSVVEQAGLSDVRLLVVPRHPERFDEVAKGLATSEMRLARRSAAPHKSDKDAQLILLDSIGELRAIFPLATIVFVGGSLIPHGGQNILEPAAAKNAIVTGPHTANFAAIVADFLADDALIQLPQMVENEYAAKLTEAFSALLRDDEKRERLSANALSLVKANSGATEKTASYLKPLLETKA